MILRGQESNPGWDEIFRVVQTGSEAHPAPSTVDTASLLWLKLSERGGADHTTPF